MSLISDLPVVRDLEDWLVGHDEEFDILDDDPLESFLRGFMFGAPPLGIYYFVGQRSGQVHSGRDLDYWEVAGSVAGTLTFAAISFGVFAGEISTSATLVSMGVPGAAAAAGIVVVAAALVSAGYMIEAQSELIDALWLINTQPFS